MRRILAVLLLAALLAAPAVAGGPRDDRRAMRDHMMDRWEGMGEAQRDHGMARAEAHGLFARLAYNAGTGMASGGFVRFHVQPETGAIHDVAVRANRSATLVPLFVAVTPTPFAWEDGPAVHGATLTLEGTGLDFMAHNNPTAGLSWRAGAATNLTFTLAPGLGAFRPSANETREVRILVGGTHAHIASNGGPILLTTANRTVTVRLAAGDSVMVRLHPVGDPQAGGLHDQLAAFRAHRLGATLRVTDADGAAMEDGEGADVQATTREIGKGRVVWDVSSEQHDGRVLFLTLDNATVDAARLDAIQLRLDNAGLRRVATTAEVLAAADGAFAVVPSDDGRTVTVAVAVPHFSSYALALTQAGSGGAPADGGASGTSSRGAPALEAGALLAVGLALLLRRRA